MSTERLPAELSLRDLRFGGRWSPWQRVKNALIYGWVRCALAIVDRLPQRWLPRLGRALGGAVFPLVRGRTRRMIAHALPHADADALARRSVRAAGENLALCLLLRRPEFRASERVRFAPGAADTLTAALSRGRGALFVSAHLGPFELCAARIVEQGVPSAIVVRESYDPRLDAHTDAHRLARGLRVIHRGRAGAPTRILRALRDGLAVGLLPDLGGRGLEVASTAFFGHRCPLPSGPAHLARVTGAPLLVGTLAPGAKSGQFTLNIREITGDGDRLHAAVAAELEAAIRRAPEHWLWAAASRCFADAPAGRATSDKP